jgi:hypothetical protein
LRYGFFGFGGLQTPQLPPSSLQCLQRLQLVQALHGDLPRHLAKAGADSECAFRSWGNENRQTNVRIEAANSFFMGILLQTCQNDFIESFLWRGHKTK